MKKPLVIVSLLALCAGSLLLKTRIGNSARTDVDLVARRLDPLSLELDHSYPPLIHSKQVSGDVQTGVVRLVGGENVKFWFIAHHRSGSGCARFDFGDGTRKYMRGSYFCCEVRIPDQEVRSREDLLAFIERHDEP
ncbi:hypothetical protein JIN84_09905 [Luteolibacter yonseiensis]|uniref:Uncharacterized protein n=1 Tax=Luteolibacter yonseiensis TaxID=1144680 RepID=A0A934VA78_9BACT|nr:hypothetical protein [Luteolibacter yonseiensis]MBK1815933.1 hypothetical protein [Luteolibacter yonseiensis]